MDKNTRLKFQQLQTEVQKTDVSNKKENTKVENKAKKTANESNFLAQVPLSPLSLRKWRKAHPNPYRDGSIYSCFKF